MRFSRIDIPAYGPFTGFVLSFPKSDTDLHLVFGPNEAGKSSLLRAIRGLLFGIRGQGGDNFLHEYSRLRIMGDLELTGGVVRRFQRRRGNKNTVLDEQGQPLPDADLKSCLGEVDEGYFDSMFGLNGEGLRSGADALLRGEGRLGEALFSARMGGTPVDVVIRDLESEAGTIYDGRAQRRLRQCLHAHTDHLRAKREALVKPEDWEAAEQRQQEVENRLTALQSRHHHLTQRRSWLERCRDALDAVGKLREHEKQLAALPRMEELPESFAADLLALKATIRTRHQEAQHLLLERDRIREQITSCTPDPAVLENEAVIQLIHAQLAVHTAHQTSLLEKQAEMTTVRQTINSLCRELGITATAHHPESLRLTRLQYAEAEEMAADLKKAVDTVGTIEKQMADLTRTMAHRNNAPATVDPSRLAMLRSLHEQAAALKEKAADLPSRRRALQTQEKLLAGLQRELPGAPSDPQQTCDLPVPTQACLERFRVRWEQSDRDLRTSADTLQILRQQAGDQEAEIQHLRHRRDLPDPQHLIDARARRDRGWQLVLDDWKGAGAREELEPGRPLQEAYAEAVGIADQIADRLRLEADAVATLAEKRLHLARLEQKRQEEEARHTTLQQEAAALHEEWRHTWHRCGVTPTTPSEMIAWRQAWQEFHLAWTDLETNRQALAEDAQAVESTRAAMAEALPTSAIGFADLRHHLGEELERHQELRAHQLAHEKRQRDTLQEHQVMEEALATAHATLEAARTRWRQLADALSISPDLPIARAMQLLAGRRELFREIDHLQSLENTCGQLKTSLADFERTVQSTAEKMGLAPAGTEILAHGLWKGLEAARLNRQRLETLREHEAEQSHQLHQREQELQSLTVDLVRRCRQAGLSNADDVDAFAAQFQTAREHRRSISHFRESLAGQARGEPVDDFIARVSAEDSRRLEEEREELTNTLDTLERELEAARHEKHAVTTDKAVLEKAGDEAARRDQLAQLEAGRLLADARRFVELQTAIGLLKGQIDRFREQNQGSFLQSASQWFSLLTGGAFERLAASFVNGDQPSIVGRRHGAPADAEVPVSGMSEGTKDQLYLSLRLAGWEQHLQSHPPMPLILDDLLVHFDDQRAGHALRALSALSQKCQVLLFTHHHHLVELARQTLEPGGFTLHTISSTTRAD